MVNKIFEILKNKEGLIEHFVVSVLVLALFILICVQGFILIMRECKSDIKLDNVKVETSIKNKLD